MPEVWYYTELRKQDQRIREQEKKIRELEEKLKDKERENKELKDDLKKLAEQKTAKRPKFPDYSLSKQERLLIKEKGKSTGRRTKAEKLKEVTREENIYPEGVSPESCVLVTSRIVTHLRDGQKEVVMYHVYRKKWGTKRGKVPGVFPRSEYGMEVVIALAFLIYELQLTTNQASKILEFFCDMKIGKSEIDSLLQNLSGRWEKEFNAIADLILLSLVVYIDETGWKISSKRCFTWIFKSINHTLLLYGEKREEEVLDRILPLEKFTGIAVTDCYRMYVKRFKKAQKCWAHFLRDAIKLMLLFPENKKYKVFFKKALKIFRDSKEVKKNSKLTEKQKEEKIIELEKRIVKLCTKANEKLNKDTEQDYRKFVNLQKRLIENLDDLFVFITTPAEPTSNHAERGLRPTSRARNNYQTSKTKKGAKRRSIITSVLTSLKQNLPAFTLKDIIDEVLKWEIEGKSLFHIQLETLQGRASP